MLRLAVKVEDVQRGAMSDKKVHFLGNVIPEDFFSVGSVLECVANEIRCVR